MPSDCGVLWEVIFGVFGGHKREFFQKTNLTGAKGLEDVGEIFITHFSYSMVIV